MHAFARLSALCLLSAALAASCGPPGKAPIAGMPAIDLDDARQALTIPPDSDSERALKEIGKAAAAGDPRAGFVEVHYLVDLFDSARYEPDPDLRAKSRHLLLGVLDIEDGGGPAITDLTIDAILVRVDRVLTIDRLHAGAGAARTLLELDRARPPRKELYARLAAVKAIARGDGPLAANATLRLADFCRVAFRDAAQAATPFRPGILVYCLYALYDSDPEPYFAAEAPRRPPQPAWTDLFDGIRSLLIEMTETKSRVAALGPRLIDEDTAFIGQAKGLMPAAPSPADVDAPMLPRAAPYEWTPLVRLGDGSKPPTADLGKRLEPIVAADRRGRVAFALSAGAPATAILAGASAAEAAGADVAELVVGYEQIVKAPSGDYWHGRAKNDRVARLGVVPVVIDRAGAGGRDMQGDGWDAGRAQLGLTVVVGPTSWKLVAPGGAWDEIPMGDKVGSAEAVAALRKQLAAVRAAYPDEDGVVLVPEAGASYLSLVSAAWAVKYDESGRRFFGAVALGQRRPAPAGKQDLPARVARRAAATVVIDPDALADRAPAARQCYQDALDRDAKLSGVLALELQKPVANLAPVAGVTSGPKDKTLRSCVTQALSPAMAKGNVKTVRVTLKPGT